MPSLLHGLTLKHSTPADMLARDKNCAAMTFSRVLGLPVNTTLHVFLDKGWILSAKDLENDNKIEPVIKKLGMAEQYKEAKWSAVKAGMKAKPDGRYFAMNWGTAGNTGTNAKGHAFSIIMKNGSVGVYGNNAEVKDHSYNATIRPDDKVTVYGPYTAT